MKVNHKQMYLMLKQQVKVLQAQVSPPAEKANEIPENFNQIGWDITIEKTQLMLDKMIELREMKGKRLTPPFYRTIYNRALIAINEIDKLAESLEMENNKDIDFESECIYLNAEIYKLNKALAEKAAEAAEAGEETSE